MTISKIPSFHKEEMGGGCSCHTDKNRNKIPIFVYSDMNPDFALTHLSLYLCLKLCLHIRTAKLENIIHPQYDMQKRDSASYSKPLWRTSTVFYYIQYHNLIGMFFSPELGYYSDLSWAHKCYLLTGWTVVAFTAQGPIKNHKQLVCQPKQHYYLELSANN